jgi:glycerol-3-phosphate dehydrogenase (NAD(P)+)
MNVFIIGAGVFGTAISNELSLNIDNKVLLYARSKKKVHEINSTRKNTKYLPEKKLSKYLTATNNPFDINKADVIFIALPSYAITNVIDLFKLLINKDQLIINLSKGIFESGQFITDYLSEQLNSDNVLSLKGPSFAVEISKKAPTLLTLGYKNEIQKSLINNIFSKTNIYLEYSKDIYGVEVLSVIKNIYAIFIGITDYKYNSPNTRFLFISKIFTEIKIITKALGGDIETIFKSCGIGDVCMTSLNELSRNRKLGINIGESNTDLNKKNSNTEGVNSINIIYDLLDDSVIKELPILKKLYIFFNSNSNSFFIDFNEIFQIKSKQ